MSLGTITKVAGYTETTIYTCPSNTAAVVAGLVINATTATAISLFVYDATTQIKTTLLNNIPVNPIGSYDPKENLGLAVSSYNKAGFTLPKPINLNPGDYISAKTLTQGQSVNIYTDVLTNTPLDTTNFTLKSQGNWNNTQAYFINDVVQYNSTLYVATTNNTGSNPPSSNWILLNSGGAYFSTATSTSVGLVRGATSTGTISISSNGTLFHQNQHFTGELVVSETQLPGTIPGGQVLSQTAYPALFSLIGAAPDGISIMSSPSQLLAPSDSNISSYNLLAQGMLAMGANTFTKFGTYANGSNNLGQFCTLAGLANSSTVSTLYVGVDTYQTNQDQAPANPPQANGPWAVYCWDMSTGTMQSKVIKLDQNYSFNGTTVDSSSTYFKPAFFTSDSGGNAASQYIDYSYAGGTQVMASTGQLAVMLVSRRWYTNTGSTNDADRTGNTRDRYSNPVWYGPRMFYRYNLEAGVNPDPAIWKMSTTWNPVPYENSQSYANVLSTWNNGAGQTGGGAYFNPTSISYNNKIVMTHHNWRDCFIQSTQLDGNGYTVPAAYVRASSDGVNWTNHAFPSSLTNITGTGYNGPAAVAIDGSMCFYSFNKIPNDSQFNSLPGVTTSFITGTNVVILTCLAQSAADNWTVSNPLPAIRDGYGNYVQFYSRYNGNINPSSIPATGIGYAKVGSTYAISIPGLGSYPDGNNSGLSIGTNYYASHYYFTSTDRITWTYKGRTGMYVAGSYAPSYTNVSQYINDNITRPLISSGNWGLSLYGYTSYTGGTSNNDTINLPSLTNGNLPPFGILNSNISTTAGSVCGNTYEAGNTTYRYDTANSYTGLAPENYFNYGANRLSSDGTNFYVTLPSYILKTTNFATATNTAISLNSVDTINFTIAYDNYSDPLEQASQSYSSSYPTNSWLQTKQTTSGPWFANTGPHYTPASNSAGQGAAPAFGTFVSGTAITGGIPINNTNAFWITNQNGQYGTAIFDITSDGTTISALATTNQGYSWTPPPRFFTGAKAYSFNPATQFVAPSTPSVNGISTWLKY